MDDLNRSNRRQLVGNASSNPESTPSTRPSSKTVQTRRQAYELSSISRLKIQKEASKSSPRLHKLVAHAAMFDNATRFILDHIDGSNVEDDLSDSVAIEGVLDAKEHGCGHIAQLEDHDQNGDETFQSSFEVRNRTSFSGYAHRKPKEGCAIVVIEALADEEGDTFEDTADESNTDSDDDDYDHFDDREIWSDAPLDGDWRKMQSDWDFWDASANLVRDSRDDDLLLWSQQPRVLSTKQAESLFLEAFG
ncbi:hypothetical protein G647_03068 [Cladophialophora carrionii CBS 160.54]|uniref:Uncharacterized protein n=1 Tax=Cladophialophora carrionii CBS 160.54 TaxID=1279043 RepID=V9DHX7_9EURO|nr:uncharacterized protein G647_03068 [Cladophialophora carrionii CBS 160.54]ETI26291.1 hypothetical protein G647_03068 [Cladophialophora carrionii CBS 160.54]